MTQNIMKAIEVASDQGFKGDLLKELAVFFEQTMPAGTVGREHMQIFWRVVCDLPSLVLEGLLKLLKTLENKTRQSALKNLRHESFVPPAPENGLSALELMTVAEIAHGLNCLSPRAYAALQLAMRAREDFDFETMEDAQQFVAGYLS